jgi:hypothetical protein
MIKTDFGIAAPTFSLEPTLTLPSPVEGEGNIEIATSWGMANNKIINNSQEE